MVTNPTEVGEVLADHFASLSKQDPTVPFANTQNLGVKHTMSLSLLTSSKWH